MKFTGVSEARWKDNILGVILKTPDQIKRIRDAGRIVGEVHEALEKMIEPGISTKELDAFAESMIRKRGGTPTFKGYRGFPATLCTSRNEVIVHGIPSSTDRLEEGDIIGIDLGVTLKGWIGDAARTWKVGKVSSRADQLVESTRRSLTLAIEQSLPGNRLGDIGNAIQTHVEAFGFSVVRDFVGHGVGRHLHEDPQVRHFGIAGQGRRLKEGMVIAIEPMINEGVYDVEVLEDEWTAVTADRKLSAHWENTIAITADGPKILTEVND